MFETIQHITVSETHRVLLYVDGKLDRVLGAGRHELPHVRGLWARQPEVDTVVVDMRERDLLIKGQEILTSDKVAIRVSIIVRYRVIDPVLAVQSVEDYNERLYTDAQLAARRSLATMTLEKILTNRNDLSDDILTDVQDGAERYGVEIVRADVKDLVFPGDFQQVMNRVLRAERLSEAELVEARTRAEVQRIAAEADAANRQRDAELVAEQRRRDAEQKVEERRREAELIAETRRLQAEADAEATRIAAEAERQAMEQQREAGAIYAENPALLRLREIEAFGELAKSGQARVFIGMDRELMVHAAKAE